MPAADLAADRARCRGGTPAGVVLAAGAGRRFGQPKATVLFAGRALVEHAVDALKGGGCDPVIVVLGAHAGRVVARMRVDGVMIVWNPEWRNGMAASLRAGLTAAETAGAPAVTVMLVDQPLVGARAVRRVSAAWSRGATVAVATYGGRQGHPVVLDRTIWSDVRAAAVGDRGARTLFAARPDLLTRLPCDDVADPRDVDTPQDLDVVEALRRGGARRDDQQRSADGG